MQKLKNISFENVTFDSGFWKSRYDLNRFVSLQSVYDRFEKTGRFDALRFNYEKGLRAYPHMFFDSDRREFCGRYEKNSGNVGRGRCAGLRRYGIAKERERTRG